MTRGDVPSERQSWQSFLDGSQSRGLVRFSWRSKQRSERNITSPKRRINLGIFVWETAEALRFLVHIEPFLSEKTTDLSGFPLIARTRNFAKKGTRVSK